MLPTSILHYCNEHFQVNDCLYLMSISFPILMQQKILNLNLQVWFRLPNP